MHWVLQEDLYRESGYQELLEILERAKIPYSTHKVIPFIGQLVPDIDIDGPVMCMGSYSLRHVAREKNWYPGVFDLADFTYDKMIDAWPGHMLNEKTIICPFSEVIEKLPSDEVFIRPIADSKFFAGSIMDRAELEPWVHGVCELKEDYGDSLSANTMVMMSEPVNILKEIRCWVVNQKVCTASLYKRGGRVLYSSDVEPYIIEYVNQRAAEHSPKAAFVMDVCVLGDHRIKIVECNTFNAAGLYAANVGKIVEAIENII